MGKGSSAITPAIPSPSRSSGKGGMAFPAPAIPSPSRSSGKGGVASPAPQNPYASQQAPQSQYASPLSGLGAIYGQYQQPSAQQTMSGYSGDSYTGGSPEFPEEFYPLPTTFPPSPPPPPPQYQQPNPYAMPFQQRYVQQFNPAPAQFVPQSARNYRSPFQGSGKGNRNRGERTYFNRPVEKNPADKSQGSTPAPSPDDYYYPPMASGGVIKAAAGRYLQGPGDGTSDSIPATIGNAQPARLADGEFVIDARTVSEIGNGSSNAGAKKLYAMMERVHRERKRAKRGQDSNADRYLPA